jgi:hypothetical protein
MTKKKPHKKNPFVNYAIVAGIALGILLVIGAWVLDALGKNPVGSNELPIVLVCYFLVLLASMLHFRLRVGELEGWRGITMGLLTNFTAASIYAVGLYFLFESSDTALSLFKRQSIVVLERLGDQIDQGIKAVDFKVLKSEAQKQTAQGIALDKFVKTSMVGVFVTFLAVLFARYFPVRTAERF